MNEHQGWDGPSREMCDDAALGRALRAACGPLGVEPERVPDEIAGFVCNYRQLQNGLSLDAMRLRAAQCLSRLVPAQHAGEVGT